MIVRGKYHILEEQHEELEKLAAQFYDTDGKTPMTADKLFYDSKWENINGRINVNSQGYVTRIMTKNYKNRTGRLDLSENFTSLEILNCELSSNTRSMSIPHTLTELKMLIASSINLDKIDLPEESTKMTDIRLEFNSFPVLKIPKTYISLKNLYCPCGMIELELPFLPSLEHLWVVGSPRMELTKRHVANMPNLKSITANGTEISDSFARYLRKDARIYIS
jgi:hypothetical protein